MKCTWTDSVQAIVDTLPDNFTTSDVYEFEGSLSIDRPGNSNIRAKIRQQLQVLRDKRKTIKPGAKPGTWVKS